MSFDLEIRNSISSLQAQVASLTQQTDRAQASLARMGTQAKVTAGQTFEISKNMEKIGATASAAGGPVAGLMTRMGGLAMFNPVALAAGAAIGALTAGVVKLTEALREAADERERLASPIDAVATREAVAGARGKLDPASLRAAVAPERSVEDIQAAGAATARRWIADMPEWAQAQAAGVGDIGMSFVTEEDRRLRLAAELSPEGKAAARVERRQAREARYAEEVRQAAIAAESGMAPKPLSEGAAISVLESGKGQSADEFRKNTEELRAMRQELQSLSRNLLAGRRKAELEANIAERSARQMQIIQAHTMTQESSQ